MAARVYEFYTSQWTHHNEKPRTRWREKDFEDCVSWAWKALKYRDGWFDPRQRKIVDVEPHFDIFQVIPTKDFFVTGRTVLEDF